MRQPAITEWLTRPGGIVEQLVALRTRAGLRSMDLANRLSWHRSKVSKLEKGSQLPSETDLRRWAEACGDPAAADAMVEMLGEVHGVRLELAHRMAAGDAQIQVNHEKMEAEAEVVRSFEVAVVPGLLQLPGYARAVLAAAYDLHGIEADIEAIVGARARRQEVIYDPGKRFEFVLAEPVLRWRLAPPDVMRAQLDRLLTATDMANVRLGVVPLSAQLHTTLVTGFVMYDDLALVEDYADDSPYEGSKAGLYAKVMERLWLDAVEGDEARQLIIRAADALR